MCSWHAPPSGNALGMLMLPAAQHCTLTLFDGEWMRMAKKNGLLMIVDPRKTVCFLILNNM
jgi:hypothetical protein